MNRNNDNWEKESKLIANHAKKHIGRSREKWHEVDVHNEKDLHREVKRIAADKETEVLRSLGEDKDYLYDRKNAIVVVRDYNAPDHGTVIKFHKKEYGHKYLNDKLDDEKEVREKTNLNLPKAKFIKGGRQALPEYDKMSKDKLMLANQKSVFFHPEYSGKENQKSDKSTNTSERSLADKVKRARSNRGNRTISTKDPSVGSRSDKGKGINMD